MGDYDMGFNFVRFINFLGENNAMSVAIAALISDRINELMNDFFNYLILPIINADFDRNGEKDVKNLENMKFSIFNIKFELGKPILSILKFIIIMYLIFILSRLFKFMNISC